MVPIEGHRSRGGLYGIARNKNLTMEDGDICLRDVTL